MGRWSVWLLLGVAACEPASAARESAEPSVATTPVAEGSRPVASASSRTTKPLPRPLEVGAYPWHGDASIDALPAVDSLEQRIDPPQGHTRVDVPAGSFGAWLRGMPLAAPGTPVRSYDGGLLLPADHPNIAAVTTLDTGKADLQQCADAVMRLHGEWLWQQGRAEEASYPTGAGPIAWARYRAGASPTPSGVSFVWTQGRARPDDHKSYRKYLDVVFSWANTVALAKHAKKIDRDAVAPGDFFIMPGAPGHSVLVLDVAVDGQGRKRALLGQSYMPAQSFQVLRPGPRQTWFSLEEDEGLQTPFWPRFAWSDLRRL